MSVNLCKEWIQKAEEDYQAALLLAKKTKNIFLNAVCFHSQQSAEKYLKGYRTCLAPFLFFDNWRIKK